MWSVEEVGGGRGGGGWVDRLAGRARIILFDKRGTGLSDRLGQLPNLEQRMDDARAVMDAAKVTGAAGMGGSEGGSLAVVFAAAHPGHRSALRPYGGFAPISESCATKQKFASC